MSPQCSQAKVAKSHGVPVGYPAFPFVLAGANYRNACLLAKFVRLASCFFCLSKYCISHLLEAVRVLCSRNALKLVVWLLTTFILGVSKDILDFGIYDPPLKRGWGHGFLDDSKREF